MGDRANGAFFYGSSGDMFYSVFFTGGTATSTLFDLQIYMSTGASNPCTIQGAVFDQLTGNLVGLSAPISINAPSVGWVKIPMPPTTIIQSRSYLLCYNVISITSYPSFGMDTGGSNFGQDYPIGATPGNFNGCGPSCISPGTLNIYADICP